MITTVLSSVSTVINAMLAAASQVVTFWPVAVAVAFLIIGFAVGFIRKFAGGKKKTKRGR